MTTSYYPARPGVQEFMPDAGQHRREIARVVNLLMRGQSNASLSVTLAAGAATTTVTDARVGISTAPLLAPTTPNAAAELGNGTLYVVPDAGKVVIHHANNAQTDRTFQLALIG